MEQAGRAVFPLFALVLGWGLRKPTGQERAAALVVPLLVFGVAAHLAAMPLVEAGVRGQPLNVLFTFAAAALAIANVGKGFRGWFYVAAALGASCWSEYGPLGVVLVFAAWIGSGWGIWLCLGLLSVSQLSLVPAAVPLLVVIAEVLCGDERFRSPRMLFGAGYVAQFAVISLLLVVGAQARA